MAETATGKRKREPMERRSIEVIPLSVPRALVPEDAERQTASEFLVQALRGNGVDPETGDVVVLSSKVAALFEGRTVRLDAVSPSRKARWLARPFSKDSRKLELMMREGRVAAVIPLQRLVRMREGWKVVEALSSDMESTVAALHRVEKYEFFTNKHGALLNEAGIDIMNSPDGYVTLLPEDPCGTAYTLRAGLREAFGVDVAVIITDTVAPIGRLGTLDIAIGYSGITPVERDLFAEDLFGDLRPGSANIIIDSIAAIAGAVMGQTVELTPAALVRGCKYTPEPEGEPSPGMAVLAYPQGMSLRGGLLMVVCTLWFHILNLLTFQRWPRKGR